MTHITDLMQNDNDEYRLDVLSDQAIIRFVCSPILHADWFIAFVDFVVCVIQ